MRDEVTKQNEQDRAVAENENEESSIQERAHERIREQDEEINEIDNEQARIEEKLPLKAIFRKYGFTVVAVFFFGVGAMIGAIQSSFSKEWQQLRTGLEMVSKCLEKRSLEFCRASLAQSSALSFARPAKWSAFSGITLGC